MSPVVPSVMQQVTALQKYFAANKQAQYSDRRNINGPESPVPLSEYYKELDFKFATSNSYIDRIKSKVRRQQKLNYLKLKQSVSLNELLDQKYW